MTTTSAIAAEARGLPPEPTARWILVLVAVFSVAWLAVLGWQVQVLPERVPTHFGPGGEPDGWSSKAGALAFSVAMPVLTAYPLPLLSRLVMHWPGAINAPNRDWWTATAARIRRFERLIREDMWLFCVLMLGLFTAIQISIVMASRSASGGLPPVLLFGSLGVFLVLTVALTARILGARYAEQDVD
ncbi:DUF1648 domain-containing protein [Dietzia sp. PP-33]|jgi:uncharacterized membrane protein|uniref:DUF1648 domain-containing protein n=1 Tax=Dietzia sp. PP-33 TaxID=2957500 RepID=UPI0029AD2E51|nr:DUF1648 domain-containing protein [Dietzia sp. PP-33]MDX2356193.1 DUF1648 domain-containing protein [Dietzia sp. PP-33]